MTEVVGQGNEPEQKDFRLRFSPGDKARTYCLLMRHRDAPILFNAQVVAQLKDWKLLDPNQDYSASLDFKSMIDITNNARDLAEEMRPDFIEAFNQNPWNFDRSVEGEYSNDELPVLFPRALELNSIKGGGLRFCFRSEPGTFYLRLIINENGKRQVLRLVDSTHIVEEINQDSQNAPEIIPKFEAVKFEDGKTGLLIDWIEGHIPSTPEEKMLCVQKAEQLLHVPIDSYDLWAGNFLIANDLDTEGNPRIYYIDQDIPQTIAAKGLAPETGADRQNQFRQDILKMH